MSAVAKKGWFRSSGGRPADTVTEELCANLIEVLEEDPEDSKYRNDNWTSEMLAERLRGRLEVFIHASTVRRLLPRLGVPEHEKAHECRTPVHE